MLNHGRAQARPITASVCIDPSAKPAASSNPCRHHLLKWLDCDSTGNLRHYPWNGRRMGAEGFNRSEGTGAVLKDGAASFWPIWLLLRNLARFDTEIAGSCLRNMLKREWLVALIDSRE